MGAVFVSYRRGDSEGQARALSIELGEIIGKDSVFMDVDSIALGRDFRAVLHERLASCDLLLALIGPGWLDAKDAGGTRRLESPGDYVRQEIAAALKRNIPVTPVLLQGASMPNPERLPEDIKDLVYRNGFELSHTRWESDVAEMAKRLGLQSTEQAADPPAKGAVVRRLKYWIGGATVVGLALAVWLLSSRPASVTPESPTRSPAVHTLGTDAAADAPTTPDGNSRADGGRGDTAGTERLIVPTPTRTIVVADLAGEWVTSAGSSTDSLRFTSKWLITAGGTISLDFFGINNGKRIAEKSTGVVTLSAARILTIMMTNESRYLLRGWLERPNMTVMKLNGPWYESGVPAQIINNPEHGVNLDELWVRAVKTK